MRRHPRLLSKPLCRELGLDGKDIGSGSGEDQAAEAGGLRGVAGGDRVEGAEGDEFSVAHCARGDRNHFLKSIGGGESTQVHYGWSDGVENGWTEQCGCCGAVDSEVQVEHDDAAIIQYGDINSNNSSISQGCAALNYFQADVGQRRR